MSSEDCLTDLPFLVACLSSLCKISGSFFILVCFGCIRLTFSFAAAKSCARLLLSAAVLASMFLNSAAARLSEVYCGVIWVLPTIRATLGDTSIDPVTGLTEVLTAVVASVDKIRPFAVS